MDYPLVVDMCSELCEGCYDGFIDCSGCVAQFVEFVPVGTLCADEV